MVVTAETGKLGAGDVMEGGEVLEDMEESDKVVVVVGVEVPAVEGAGWWLEE